MGKKVVGVDIGRGEDVGVVIEGYWLNGVYTITREQRLTKGVVGGDVFCTHNFVVTDDVFDYCVHCGAKRPAVNANQVQGA